MDYKEVAKSWLSEEFDEQTRIEVQNLIDNNPKELEDSFYRNLEFGTGGMRALMGVGTNRMNKYTIAMATQGLANYINKFTKGEKASVCISYDCRNNQDVFSKITSDVLRANGLDVYIFDALRPTPELSYAIRSTKSIAGIMLTASHNPKEYNGYKVFWSDGAQITYPVDNEIITEVSKISSPSQVKFDLVEKSGQLIIMGEDMDNKYLKDILSLTLSPELCKKHNDLKIVYTPLHGCGVKLVPEALRRLGFKNIYNVPEQDISDGNFPTVISPNPEDENAMDMAKVVAEKVEADIILDSDPDADRIGVAVRNDEGDFVLLNGNQTASILTYYILTRRKELGVLKDTDYIVKTIVTTGLLKDIANSFGIDCYDVLTGFKYIAEVVKKNEDKRQFICGGEESFGFNIGEFVRDKDSVISCAMMVECAAWALEQGLTIYQLLQKIYKEYGYRKESLKSLVKKGKEGAEEIRALMDKFRNESPEEILGYKVLKVIDYLKPELTGYVKSNVLQFFLEDESIISVRPSGTEPKIKFYFSAKGEDADQKIDSLSQYFS